ncbi:MAG: hypothetical protein OEZ43_06200 [Gammaproteobacteria bacterium]|nr:hypothetical protein [Gammaproteobacteria bacterium]
MSARHNQSGSLMIELVIVMTIVVILGSVAMPDLHRFLVRRDIDNTRSMLIQSLHYAKQMARAENTLVDVQVGSNRLTIKPRNTAREISRQFSQRINLVSANNTVGLSFVFRPMGTLAREDDDLVIDADADLLIKILPQDTRLTGIEDSVVIGNYGSLASR